MDKRARIKKVVIFIVTGGGAYCGLVLAGHSEDALKEVPKLLQAVLGASVGGISALIAPPKEKEKPGPPPPQPDAITSGSPAVEAQVPASAYQKVVDEVLEWRRYGENAKGYMLRQDAARRQMDMKQTVLRTSLFGIVGLAFFLCVAGFIAPKPLANSGVVNREAVFLGHFAYLSAAFVLGGLIVGAVIDRVRVKTFGWHAFRAALISASLLSVGSLLVTLPYVFDAMWGASVTFAGRDAPMLVWVALFRMVIAPLMCACAAWLSFGIVKFFLGEKSDRGAFD